jgi:hypothetical protein
MRRVMSLFVLAATLACLCLAAPRGVQAKSPNSYYLKIEYPTPDANPPTVVGDWLNVGGLWSYPGTGGPTFYVVLKNGSGEVVYSDLGYTVNSYDEEVDTHAWGYCDFDPIDLSHLIGEGTFTIEIGDLELGWSASGTCNYVSDNNGPDHWIDVYTPETSKKLLDVLNDHTPELPVGENFTISGASMTCPRSMYQWL